MRNGIEIDLAEDDMPDVIKLTGKLKKYSCFENLGSTLSNFFLGYALLARKL